ncbi:MAG: hypothetical protein EHM45_13680 [Desulfobacteraceae bacterium]|nr:MAG: hypothetical protein EHM45_13680 [Desulfobacteraceae bacterium]
MAFPRKFKHLLEIDKGDITTPSHVWITYCVCAVNKDSCGWGGWTLETVFSDPNSKAGENLLPSQTDQKCTACGGVTYRTGVSYRFDLSSNQDSPIDEFEYDVVPIEYTDE